MTGDAGRFNRWYRRICISHDLTRHEVVEIMRVAGMEISSSRADGWKRVDTESRRGATMTEPEFEAFTNGLVEWLRDKK
jgi:hypothetical protein